MSMCILTLPLSCTFKMTNLENKFHNKKKSISRL